MGALDKNSRARANYSGALLSILHAIAFSMRVFVKFKSSGTIPLLWYILTIHVDVMHTRAHTHIRVRKKFYHTQMFATHDITFFNIVTMQYIFVTLCKQS